MFDFIYNGVLASTKFIRVAERPALPSAEASYTAYSIPGRDGELRVYDGTVEDVVITVEVSFLPGSAASYQQRFAQMAAWLYGDGNKRLIFTDQPGVYYKVKGVEITGHSRDVHEAGTFTIAFDAEGCGYEVSGSDTWTTIATGTQMTNTDGMIWKPVYRFVGAGVTTISISGGNDVEINLPDGNPAIVDTGLMIAYREDTGTTLNTNITGDYADLWIRPGVSSYTVDGDATATIHTMRRWRL